jgi:hypothetical protein
MAFPDPANDRRGDRKATHLAGKRAGVANLAAVAGACITITGSNDHHPDRTP